MPMNDPSVNIFYPEIDVIDNSYADLPNIINVQQERHRYLGKGDL